MLQVLQILLVASVIVFAIKAALILLLIAGLIFRTKETVGLLAVLIVIALFNRYTTAALALLGVVGVVALVRWLTTASDPPELPDKTGD